MRTLTRAQRCNVHAQASREAHGDDFLIDDYYLTTFAATEPVAKTGGPPGSYARRAADSSQHGAPASSPSPGGGATPLHAAEAEPARHTDDTGFAPGALM